MAFIFKNLGIWDTLVQGGSRQFNFGGSKYSNDDVIMTSHNTNPPKYWGVRGPPGPPTDYPPALIVKEDRYFRVNITKFQIMEERL